MDRMVVAAIWAVPEICTLNTKFVGIISLTLQLQETKRCTLIYLWCTGLWPGSVSVCLCKMKFCRFSSLPRCWLTWSHVGTWLRSQPYFLLRINLDTFQNTLVISLSFLFRLTMYPPEIWAREGPPITSSFETGFFSADGFELYLFRMNAVNWKQMRRNDGGGGGREDDRTSAELQRTTTDANANRRLPFRSEDKYRARV